MFVFLGKKKPSHTTKGRPNYIEIYHRNRILDALASSSAGYNKTAQKDTCQRQRQRPENKCFVLKKRCLNVLRIICTHATTIY